MEQAKLARLLPWRLRPFSSDPTLSLSNMDEAMRAYCERSLRRWQDLSALYMAVFGCILDVIGLMIVFLFPELPKTLTIPTPHVAFSLVCLSSWFVLQRLTRNRSTTWLFALNLVVVTIGFATMLKEAHASSDANPLLSQSAILLYTMISGGALSLFPTYTLATNAAASLWILCITIWSWYGQTSLLLPISAACATGVLVLVGKSVFWRAILRDAASRYRIEKAMTDAKQALAQREIDLARRIQDSFRPHEELNWQGRDIRYFAHKNAEVGGDWAAIQVDDQNTLTLAVVDAAGKGLQAALVVHAVQSLWAEHSAIPAPLDALDWLDRVNRSLVVMGKHEVHMVTLGLIQLRGDQGIYWSAGHVPLFLVHESQPRRLETIVGTGTPLGVMPTLDIKPANFRLTPSARLLLGSDGVFHKGTRQRQSEVYNILDSALSLNTQALAALPTDDDKTLILVDSSKTGQKDQRDVA